MVAGPRIGGVVNFQNVQNVSVSSRTGGMTMFPSNLSGKRYLSTGEKMSFQAETRKLLDIVTHSIYTDKEVFIRELISNASDALEKYRYFQVTGAVNNEEGSSAQPLEINIYTDPLNCTLTLVDNGIGMSKDELIGNLGTIARSGSKQFVENLTKNSDGTPSKSTTDGIIGQFGVGFYSSFMVSEHVSVESVSATSPDAVPHKWSSDGSGEFEIAPSDNIEKLTTKHGSKITMKLKESCREYADADRIKSVIKHYSSFVSFPIKVDGEVVNTVSAIWTQDKRSVTEEQYEDFYKFISNAYDSPKYRLHFRTDAPIDLKVLLYIPSFHGEKFGMGVTPPGVNLYSRKVLIESKPKDLLPDWLRFVKGVVDSEDLPLSLSREKPQDSNLLKRIREVLSRKFLKFLEDELKRDPVKYKEFYIEYHMFLKQGICQDYKFMDALSKLVMFESTGANPGDLVTLDDYISRSVPEQKEIYYLVAPSRDAALNSPYYETFKKHNKEVLLLYNTIDDFVMSNIKTYSGRTLVSAEQSSINFDESAADSEQDGKKDKPRKLSDSEAKDLCEWFKVTLGKKVREVKITNRLSDSPAIITDHDSGALRRMMKLVEQANNQKQANELPPQIFEINPSHPLLVSLFDLKDDPSSAASLVANQLFDNSLMTAGLLEDPRSMIPRLNDILLSSLKK